MLLLRLSASDGLRFVQLSRALSDSKHGIDSPRPGAFNRNILSPSRKPGMPQHVRTWAVMLVAAALTGAPALRTGAAGWPDHGQRISKRATSHRNGRSRTSARLAPSLVRQERAMIDPPRPTHNSPVRVGHVTVDTRRPGQHATRRVDRASPPATSLLIWRLVHRLHLRQSAADLSLSCAIL